MNHNCKEWTDSIIEMDRIRGNTPKAIYYYGPAITKIEFIEDTGAWVAHCDEYATIINFCPFCGMKLRYKLIGRV